MAVNNSKALPRLLTGAMSPFCFAERHNIQLNGEQEVINAIGKFIAQSKKFIIRPCFEINDRVLVFFFRSCISHGEHFK
jgi:hypothetical protein